MTRDSDVFISLSERANIANAFSADYFISFHINSGGGTGFESYIYNALSNSKDCICKATKNAYSCQSCINKIWSS